MNCSKCQEPAARALVIPTIDKTSEPGKKNNNGVRLVRFCKAHWHELEQLLPAV